MRILQQTEFIKAIEEILKAIQNESKEPIDIDFCNENYDTIFHELLRSRNIEQVKLLITKFPDLGTEYIKGSRNPKVGITTKNLKGHTPLHLATDYLLEEIVELLLNKGVKPNKQDNYSITPLHLAVNGNNRQITEMLLNKGAKPNIQLDDDRTALHLAVHNNNTEIVELLLSKGANINDIDKMGHTALHIAVKDNNKTGIVKLLINNRADPNIRNIYSRNALHTALVSNASTDILKMILDKIVDLNTKDAVGNTALEIAMKQNCQEIITLIQNYSTQEENLDNGARVTSSMNQDAPSTSVQRTTSFRDQEVSRRLTSQTNELEM